MAWIESHQKLEKSGKVLALAQKLGINRYQVIGHLHALWWWALDNAPDGNIARYRPAIATLTGWEEVQRPKHKESEIWDPEKFVRALIESGFLDERGDRLLIHDWRDYTWRYLEIVQKGELERERWRLVKRNQRQAKPFCPPNVHQDVHPPVHPLSTNVHPPTRPNLTIPSVKNRVPLRFTPPLEKGIEEHTRFATVPVAPREIPDLNQNKKERIAIAHRTIRDDSKERCVELMKLWNEKAHVNLARVRYLPKDRERSIKARIEKNPDPQFWIDVIAKINQSEFLTGVTTRWKCTFDWMMDPNNLTKILEDSYDNREGPRKRRD